MSIAIRGTADCLKCGTTLRTTKTNHNGWSTTRKKACPNHECGAVFDTTEVYTGLIDNMLKRAGLQWNKEDQKFNYCAPSLPVESTPEAEPQIKSAWEPPHHE